MAPLFIIRITGPTMSPDTASDTGMDTDMVMAIPGDFHIIIITIDPGAETLKLNLAGSWEIFVLKLNVHSLGIDELENCLVIFV